MGLGFESLRVYNKSNLENGSVAQLNRALDYGSRGSRFESLRNHLKDSRIAKFGSVAQLNRALDYGSRGSRFESLRSHSPIKASLEQKVLAP